MNLPRTLWFHTSLLVLSGALGVWAFTRDKTASAVQEGEITLWNGRAADVQRIVYEAKDRKVVLEPQAGPEPWNRLTIERTPPPAGSDAGAAAQAKATQVFPGNETSKKAVEFLAQLRASRSVGRLADGRASEYGLDKKETSLTVVLAGRERKLFVGEEAPGGTDVYISDAASGDAYVVKSEHFRALQQADNRLMERDLHGWKDSDAKKAKIAVGSRSREVVRGGSDTHRFWADPTASDKADETVENWIQKIDRLKPVEYAQKDPEGATVVVRIDYTGSSPLGYFQLSKSPDPAQAGKSVYWVQSERTHLFGKANASLAEQVEQDLASVLK